MTLGKSASSEILVNRPSIQIEKNEQSTFGQEIEQLVESQALLENKEIKVTKDLTKDIPLAEQDEEILPFGTHMSEQHPEEDWEELLPFSRPTDEPLTYDTWGANGQTMVIYRVHSISICLTSNKINV